MREGEGERTAGEEDGAGLGRGTTPPVASRPHERSVYTTILVRWVDDVCVCVYLSVSCMYQRDTL